MKVEAWNQLEPGDMLTGISASTAYVVKLVSKGIYAKPNIYRMKAVTIDGKEKEFDASYPRYWRLVRKSGVK